MRLDGINELGNCGFLECFGAQRVKIIFLTDIIDDCFRKCTIKASEEGVVDLVERWVLDLGRKELVFRDIFIRRVSFLSEFLDRAENVLRLSCCKEKPFECPEKVVKGGYSCLFPVSDDIPSFCNSREVRSCKFSLFIDKSVGQREVLLNVEHPREYSSH